MSSGFFFVSKNKIDSRLIEELHSKQYSLDDFTQYVKDAKKEFHYYMVEPYIIYIGPSQKFVDIKDREMSPAEFLIYFANELYRDDGFLFVHCNLSDDDIREFKFQLYINKHKKERIAMKDFCEKASNPENLFLIDNIYVIMP